MIANTNIFKSEDAFKSYVFNDCFSSFHILAFERHCFCCLYQISGNITSVKTRPQLHRQYRENKYIFVWQHRIIFVWTCTQLPKLLKY